MVFGRGDRLTSSRAKAGSAPAEAMGVARSLPLGDGGLRTGVGMKFCGLPASKWTTVLSFKALEVAMLLSLGSPALLESVQ
jgi:hypothetical protein